MKFITKKIMLIITTAIMIVSLTACQTGSELADKKIPEFKAEDFSGNSYTESIFSENKVTVVNFWFTGCQSCIEEMPYLEQMNKKLAEQNVKLLGICTDAGTEEIDKEIQKILQVNNVSFPNLKIKDGDEMKKLISSIVAFPTTLVINKDGKIVGKPIVGALNSQAQENEINERIKIALSENAQ